MKMLFLSFSKLMHKEKCLFPLRIKDEIKSETMPFQTWKFIMCLKRDFNKQKMLLNIIQLIELSLRKKLRLNNEKQEETTYTGHYALQ